MSRRQKATPTEHRYQAAQRERKDTTPELSALTKKITQIGAKSSRRQFSNISAEFWLLGALASNIIEGFTTLSQADEKLKPDHFYMVRCRRMFTELKRIYDQDRLSGANMTPIILLQHLKEAGILKERKETDEEIDGYSDEPDSEHIQFEHVLLSDIEAMFELAEVAGVEDAPATTTRESIARNIPHYAAEIRQLAVKRKMHEIYLKAGKAFIPSDAGEANPHTIAEKLMLHAHEIADIVDNEQGGTVKDLGSAAKSVLASIDAERAADEAGIDYYNGMKTELPRLDRITGGFRGGQLVTLGARTGGGKTALALYFAHMGLQPRKGEGGSDIYPSVLFFSMEMKAEELVKRMIAMYTDIPQDRLRTQIGNPDRLDDKSLQEIKKCVDDFQSANLWIEDRSTMTIADIKAAAHSRWHAGKKTNEPLRLIIVDYLQLCAGDPAKFGGKFTNRVEEVANVSRGLKMLAMQLDVTVIALAQLNRAHDSRTNKSLQLSDLRESGSIEQDSDMVIFLEPENLNESPHDRQERDVWNMVLNVAKNRQGKQGKAPVFFMPSVNQFAPPSETSVQSPPPSEPPPQPPPGWQPADEQPAAGGRIYAEGDESKPF